jgi:hypothetical protein
MLHILRGGELLKKLDRVRRPIGNVVRQLLQHQRRALAPAKRDGVGDFGARRGDLGRDAVQ